METQDIYTNIIDKLSSLKDNKEQLTQILQFLDKQEIKEINKQTHDEIPYEYESIISQISEAVYNGFICYLNPETLEIEQVSAEVNYDPVGAEYGEQNEDMIDEFGLTYTEWDSYIRFEPFGRDDLLNRIDTFVNNLDDQNLKSQLENFTETEELINQFSAIMERTGYSDDWDLFIRNEIESYVRAQVISGLSRKVKTNEDIYSL